jgi:hypothetical protein
MEFIFRWECVRGQKAAQGWTARNAQPEIIAVIARGLMMMGRNGKKTA